MMRWPVTRRTTTFTSNSILKLRVAIVGHVKSLERERESDVKIGQNKTKKKKMMMTVLSSSSVVKIFFLFTGERSCESEEPYFDKHHLAKIS